MDSPRLVGVAIVALGLVLALFGASRVGAAQSCATTDVGSVAAAGCEDPRYWMGVTILGAVIAGAAGGTLFVRARRKPSHDGAAALARC